MCWRAQPNVVCAPPEFFDMAMDNAAARFDGTDALGRLRREYFPRIHPFERYREDKFQARYRLTKELAGALADHFGQSEFATSGRPMGGGMSHRDRVRYIKNV